VNVNAIVHRISEIFGKMTCKTSLVLSRELYTEMISSFSYTSFHNVLKASEERKSLPKKITNSCSGPHLDS
jgi:hypothetical protein